MKPVNSISAGFHTSLIFPLQNTEYTRETFYWYGFLFDFSQSIRVDFDYDKSLFLNEYLGSTQLSPFLLCCPKYTKKLPFIVYSENWQQNWIELQTKSGRSVT